MRQQAMELKKDKRALICLDKKKKIKQYQSHTIQLEEIKYKGWCAIQQRNQTLKK